MGAPEYIYRDQDKKVDFDQSGGKAKSLLLVITMNDDTKRKFKVKAQDTFELFGELYLNTDNPEMDEQKQKALKIAKRFMSGKDISDLFEQMNSQSTDPANKEQQDAMANMFSGVDKITKIIRYTFIGFFIFIILFALISILAPLIFGTMR